MPRPPWWQVVLIGRNPRVTLVRLAVTLLLIFGVREFALVPVRIKGISMLPTYRDGAFTVVNRLAFLSRPPRRGDVVAVRFAGEHLMLMKRIIGLPGETIEFRDGLLFVNGQYLPEPYVKLPCDWDTPPKAIGPNEYYVVGDNRSMPPHYHEQGRAVRERIVGKAL